MQKEKVIDNNTLNSYYKNHTIDEDEIKVLDFDNLGYGEKKCLYVLNKIVGYYRDSYSFKTYDEDKVCIYKDNDIWQVYLTVNNSILFLSTHTSAYEVCINILSHTIKEEIPRLFNMINDKEITEEEVENYIEELKNRYNYATYSIKM